MSDVPEYIVLRRHSKGSPWYAMNPPCNTFPEAQNAIRKAKAYQVTRCEYRIYILVSPEE